MTRILVQTIADSRDGSRLLDATIVAQATRARQDGPTLTLPEPVVVRLRRGVLTAPLDLQAPDGSWAWRFSVRPSGARAIDALVLLRTFSGEEVEWAAMTPVDPETLAPLDPVPPSAAQVLLRAEEAVTVGEQAIEDATGALSVANTAVVSAAVVGDNLRGTRKNGETFDMGNVRGLPGSTVPWGTDLGTADLNTITDNGVYRQGTNATATLERNYPLVSNGGILEVFRVLNADNLVQRFTVYNGTSYNRGPFVRRRIGGTWGSWVFAGSSRTDKTAGIAIYGWDEVAQREQLVYGDTGWRQMSGFMENGWTASSLLLRRIGRQVIIRGYYLNPAAATSDTFVLLPAGFRRGVVSIALPIQAGPTVASFIALAATAATTPRTAGIVGSSIGWEVQYEVDEAWPTTLPGTATGTIPNT